MKQVINLNNPNCLEKSMTLQEIKDAVDKGIIVIWKQPNYRVVKWTNGYHVVCTNNDHAIALTWKDGITMNGDEQDFSIFNSL